MKRIAPLIFFAASGLVLAQQPAQDSPGAWRRVGDPPPASAPAATPAPAPSPAATPSQNPEPTARDQYGQPVAPPQGAPVPQQPQDAQAPQQPQDAPPAADPDALTSPAPPPEVMQPPAAAQPQTTPQQAPTRPAYGLPHQLTLQPGSYLTVRINQPLSSDRNHEGDPFTASLMQPVVVDGVVVVQRGQTVYGRVAEAQKAHTDKPSRLKLELTGLTIADGTQIPLQSQLVTRQGGTTPGGVQAGTIVGTTAVGAAIGGAAAWGTGAAIGAGAGAAAGIIGVLVTRHHPTVVYPETALTFQVTTPVTVSTDRAPQAFRFVGPEDYQPGMQYATRPGPRPVGPGSYYYAPGYAPAYGYGYPYPYYYGYGYPYYWGPGIGVYWGGGWGGWGYRRWR